MNFKILNKKAIAIFLVLAVVFSSFLAVNALGSFTFSCPTNVLVGQFMSFSGTYTGTLNSVQVFAEGSSTQIGGGGKSTPGNWVGGGAINTPGTYSVYAKSDDGTHSNNVTVTVVTPAPPTPTSTPTPTPTPAPVLTLSCPTSITAGQSVQVNGTYQNFPLTSLTIYANGVQVGGGGSTGGGLWSGSLYIANRSTYSVYAISTGGVVSNTVYVTVN